MDPIRIRRRIRIRILHLQMETRRVLRRTAPPRSSRNSQGLLLRRRDMAGSRGDSRRLGRGRGCHDRPCLRQRRRRLSLCIILQRGSMCLDLRRCLRVFRGVGYRTSRRLLRHRRFNLLLRHRHRSRRSLHRLRSHLLLLRNPRTIVEGDRHRRVRDTIRPVPVHSDNRSM
jgi:hypothetical protein